MIKELNPKAPITSMYTSGNFPEIRLTFDTYTEFIDSCIKLTQQPEYRNSGFKSYNDHWSGSTWLEAKKMAQYGWREGREKMQVEINKLEMASHVKKPETYFDVTGDYGFDMGRVMSGEPECFMAEYDTDNEKDHGRIIRIVVNNVISAAIPLPVIMRRGAAIIALIDALETANYRIELDMVCAAVVGRKCLTHIVPLKHADTDVSADQIAFAIGHPSIERRFNFIAIDLFEPNYSGHYGYGMPVDIKSDADLYVPALNSMDANWHSIESVNKWITTTLHTLGVSLIED